MNAALDFTHFLARPDSQWRDIVAPLQSSPGERSPERYLQVIDQFQVGGAPRYQPKKDERTGALTTYCNIFASDVTRAMGAHIPHWVVGIDEPSSHMVAGARETRANDIHALLIAGAWGWRLCSFSHAAECAQMGMPTVAAWKNKAGPGHIAMVVPNGSASHTKDLMIIQAGAECGRMPIAQGFGEKRFGDCIFATHE